MREEVQTYARYPSKCPNCNLVTFLFVADDKTVTTQIHNGSDRHPGCASVFQYRCWVELGLPLPRVEFLSAANAMAMMLHHDSSHRTGIVHFAAPVPRYEHALLARARHFARAEPWRPRMGQLPMRIAT